jgi:hypothetical protein
VLRPDPSGLSPYLVLRCIDMSVGVAMGNMGGKMQFLDNIPLWVAVALALTLGLAPFVPEPHIVEKLRMLSEGTLRRPLDIFDFCLHAAPWLLLIAKIVRMVTARG